MRQHCPHGGELVPREFTSPVGVFSGSVVLAEPLSAPLYLAWQDVALAIDAEAKRDGATVASVNAIVLRGLIESGVVLEWKLSGIVSHPTFEAFPFTPRAAREQLIGWLMRCVAAVIQGEDEVPKA